MMLSVVLICEKKIVFYHIYHLSQSWITQLYVPYNMFLITLWNGVCEHITLHLSLKSIVVAVKYHILESKVS